VFFVREGGKRKEWRQGKKKQAVKWKSKIRQIFQENKMKKRGRQAPAGKGRRGNVCDWKQRSQ